MSEVGPKRMARHETALLRGGRCERRWTDRVTCCIDVANAGLKIFINFNSSITIQLNTHPLQTKMGGCGNATTRPKEHVGLDRVSTYCNFNPRTIDQQMTDFCTESEFDPKRLHETSQLTNHFLITVLKNLLTSINQRYVNTHRCKNASVLAPDDACAVDGHEFGNIL